tara:strand:+ start:1838 stop:2236 length:399 start_codon:yes stop_codon:yes gene_type:complete
MVSSVDLRDYMLPNPITVAADDELYTAIDVIVNGRISGVCVVDSEHNLVGVLSEMDCLRATLGGIYNASACTGKVSEYMTSRVISCDIRADLVSVAADMLKEGHRRRPVVDGNRLVGQITCRQLLRVITDFK